ARAYGVARSAAVVRVRPPALGLVAANARLNIAGLATSAAAALLGVLVSKTIGTSWDLRFAAIAFLVGGATALRLPSHVDGKAGHGDRARFDMREAPRHVRRALVATTSLRGLSGLLTLGLAILLKAHHVHLFTVA